jgi:hypothetical protein
MDTTPFFTGFPAFSPSSPLLTTDPSRVVESAATSFADPNDDRAVRAVLDSVLISSQARAIASAFSSIYSSTGLVSSPLGNALSSFSGSSWYTATPPPFGVSDTLAFLRPTNLFTPTDVNDDGRLTLGDLFDIAA